MTNSPVRLPSLARFRTLLTMFCNNGAAQVQLIDASRRSLRRIEMGFGVAGNKPACRAASGCLLAGAARRRMSQPQQLIGATFAVEEGQNNLLTRRAKYRSRSVVSLRSLF